MHSKAYIFTNDSPILTFEIVRFSVLYRLLAYEVGMAVHYYLSVFPMEALIASQLDPMHFGAYMATGSKKGSIIPRFCV